MAAEHRIKKAEERPTPPCVPRAAPGPGGRHLLADLYGCPAELLDDDRVVRNAIEGAADACGAMVVDKTFHHFPGGGVTGVVAVMESHLTIHTWPLSSYAAVDIFLCGQLDPQIALRHIVTSLRPLRTEVRELVRGLEET